MNLAGVFLITDLDGTLLPSSKVLNGKDIKAIDRLIESGGIFSFATGRVIQSAVQYFKAIKVNVPVILGNGGMIYDIDKKSSL